jgi:hypothetical protein
MQTNSPSKRAVLTVLLVIVAVAVAAAQNTPTVLFVNYSGGDATVKLVGPTAGYVEVPNGATRTVGVRGGYYTIVTRLPRRQNLDHASQGSQRQLSHGAGKIVGFLETAAITSFDGATMSSFAPSRRPSGGCGGASVRVAGRVAWGSSPRGALRDTF